MNGIRNGDLRPSQTTGMNIEPPAPRKNRMNTHPNMSKTDWIKYKEAVESSIPTELTLPTTAYGIFSFLRKVIIIREEPGIDPTPLDSKIENEWEQIAEADKIAYERVAESRNSTYQLTNMFGKDEMDIF